jgi:hypothetical protein
VTEENVKKLGKALGWSILGGAVFGSIGLLAGLIATGKRKEVTFIVKFDDGRKMLATADLDTYRIILKHMVRLDINIDSLKAVQDSNETEVENPLEILKTRYAKGEITKEEFEQIKRDII